jgi:hypothetical protein
MSAPRNHVRILENQINWLVSERNEMEAVRHAQNERISVMARQLGQFVVRNGDLEFELANLRRCKSNFVCSGLSPLTQISGLFSLDLILLFSYGSYGNADTSTPGLFRQQWGI